MERKKLLRTVRNLGVGLAVACSTPLAIDTYVSAKRLHEYSDAHAPQQIRDKTARNFMLRSIGYMTLTAGLVIAAAEAQARLYDAERK